MRFITETGNIDEALSIDEANSLNIKIDKFNALKEELRSIKDLVDSEGGNPDQSVWVAETRVIEGKTYIMYVYSAPKKGKEDTTLRISAMSKDYRILRMQKKDK